MLESAVGWVRDALDGESGVRVSLSEEGQLNWHLKGKDESTL